MSAAEDVNREVVQVVDTATRKTCFDWRRTFPPTYYRMRAAAMAPSGEFVAIKLENKLSIYRDPGKMSVMAMFRQSEGPYFRRVALGPSHTAGRRQAQFLKCDT